MPIPSRLLRILLATILLAASEPGAVPAEEQTPAKPRLLVLTDIGGDPDDQQSMIRLMTYANEFEIEGLIASAAGTAGELKKDVTHPAMIRAISCSTWRLRMLRARVMCSVVVSPALT